MSGAARRLLGRPTRRVFDRRVPWTVDEIDARLVTHMHAEEAGGDPLVFFRGRYATVA